MQKEWKVILQTAAAYIGTVVGAGFATGKEIVQFFTKYGTYGLIGIIISGLFFIWLGYKMMAIAQDIQAKSYQQLNNYLFGQTIGKFVNVFTVLILFGITSVMLASTGAIAKEQLGWLPQIGMLITAVLCYISIVKGLEGILIVNSLVVPMMLVFSIIIIFPYMTGASLLPSSFPEAGGNMKWLMSPFLYAAFNLAMSQAVLVPLGYEMKAGMLSNGAIIGGLGLTFMLIASHLALSNLSSVLVLEIPMGEVIKHLGVWINGLFMLVIYGEIFTTLIGNVFGMARPMQTIFPVKESTWIIVILLLAFTIGQIGYGVLLTILYPLFGYMGLVFMFVLGIRRIKK